MSPAYYLSIIVPAMALASYTVLAVLVARRQTASRVNLTFLLYLLSMIIWSGASLMIRLDADHATFWSRVLTSIGIGCMPLAWFAFAQAFLGLDPINWRLLPGILAAAGLITATALGYMIVQVTVDPATRLVQVQFGSALLFYEIYWGAYLIWSAVILVRAYRRARDLAWRNRIRYPLIGVVLVMFGAVTNGVESLGKYPLDIAANLVNAFLLAYAIARYQLVDIALVVRQATAWLFGISFVAAIYAFGLLILQAVFINQLGGLVVLGLAVSLIIWMVSPGLRRWLQDIVDQAIWRERYNLHVMLNDVSHTVTRLRPLPELGELILKRVVETMALRHGLLLAGEPNTGRFVGIAAVPPPLSSTAVTWRQDHPLLIYFQHHDRPLLREEFELLPQIRSLWAREREELNALAGKLFVPVLASGHLLAVLVFGDKLNGQPFSADDISALSTLANQTAIAIDNAWLYQEVRREANKLAQVNDELRRVDKVKDEFIQNISHELRTPLMLIKGYIELLQKEVLGPLTAEQAEALRTVLQRANVIIEMVNDILALTREQSEPMRLEPLNLGQIAENSIALAQAAAESAGIQMSLSYPPDLPMVAGDARRLSQVMDNLLGNAIKFSPAGGAVAVRIAQRDARIEVCVADQGIGIAAHDLPHIWERFYQADAGATRRFAGSGLGLAIVKRIVEGHGGEVGVVSAPGQGSTFTFTLPIRPAGAGQAT